MSSMRSSIQIQTEIDVGLGLLDDMNISRGEMDSSLGVGGLRQENVIATHRVIVHQVDGNSRREMDVAVRRRFPDLEFKVDVYRNGKGFGTGYQRMSLPVGIRVLRHIAQMGQRREIAISGIKEVKDQVCIG